MGKGWIGLDGLGMEHGWFGVGQGLEAGDFCMSVGSVGSEGVRSI